jgi:hypothetical protein
VIRRPVVISRESTKLYRLRGQVSGGATSSPRPR